MVTECRKEDTKGGRAGGRMEFRDEKDFGPSSTQGWCYDRWHQHHLGTVGISPNILEAKSSSMLFNKFFHGFVYSLQQHWFELFSLWISPGRLRKDAQAWPCLSTVNLTVCVFYQLPGEF